MRPYLRWHPTGYPTLNAYTMDILHAEALALDAIIEAIESWLN